MSYVCTDTASDRILKSRALKGIPGRTYKGNSQRNSKEESKFLKDFLMGGETPEKISGGIRGESFKFTHEENAAGTFRRKKFK